MELTGSVAGIINLLGGGSDVVITPLLLEGVAIAKITVDNTDFYIYAPEGGSNITVTPTLQAGTKIGDITIGENTVALYAPNPTSVSVNQEVTEGSLIGSITVNGATTNLFAPASGGGDVNYSTIKRKVGKWIDGITDVWEQTIELNNISYTAGSINLLDNTINTNNVSHFMVIFATYIDDDFNHRSVSIAGGPVEMYLSGAGLCVRNNSQIRIRGLYACIRFVEIS